MQQPEQNQPEQKRTMQQLEQKPMQQMKQQMEQQMKQLQQEQQPTMSRNLSANSFPSLFQENAIPISEPEARLREIHV